MHNQEIQLKNKEKQTNKQTFDLNMAEITPTTVDENSCTNNIIHTGSEIRLSNKHISLLPKSFAMAKHTEKNI
jgi:hypothetical protein